MAPHHRAPSGKLTGCNLRGVMGCPKRVRPVLLKDFDTTGQHAWRPLTTPGQPSAVPLAGLKGYHLGGHDFCAVFILSPTLPRGYGAGRGAPQKRLMRRTWLCLWACIGPHHWPHAFVAPGAIPCNCGACGIALEGCPRAVFKTLAHMPKR